MTALLLALIFACGAFNVFFLIMIMYHVSNIEDIARYFLSVRKREAKLKLNSMYGKMVYAGTDSVRVQKEMKNDKGRK